MVINIQDKSVIDLQLLEGVDNHRQIGEIIIFGVCHHPKFIEDL